MNKYPYTFEEFKEEAEKQFMNDYFKDNKELGTKTLKDNDIQKAIIEGYNSNKFKHENDISEALKNIANEVSGTVYCMSMLI